MRTWSVRGTAFALCTRSSSLSIRTSTSMGDKYRPTRPRLGCSAAEPPVLPSSEACVEPVEDLRRAALEDRQVPVLLADVSLDAREALLEPAAVRDRDHQILDALPEQHRDADVSEPEPPRAREREVVVAPAGDAGREGPRH